MRVAAAVIGGLGAVLGALNHLLTIAFAVAIFALSGYLFPLTVGDLALYGTSAAGLLLAVVGAAGARLTLGARYRRGALLMLLSAAGIAVVAASQPALLNAATAYGVPERLRTDPGVSPRGLLDVLAPAPAPLLLGAALAFLAAGRTRERP